MSERTTNAQLAERMAGIEATLKHMATREDVAELRQDVRSIEKQLPVFNRAADRTDVQKGRQIQRDRDTVEIRSDRSFWASLIALAFSGVAVAIAIIEVAA